MAIPVLNPAVCMKTMARHWHIVVYSVTLVLAGCVVALPLWGYIRKEQCAKSFETNAKARLRPGEIQQWATNLLSHTQNGRIQLAKAGIGSTNPLVSLYPAEPSIFIDGSEGESGDAGSK